MNVNVTVFDIIPGGDIIAHETGTRCLCAPLVIDTEDRGNGHLHIFVEHNLQSRRLN